MGASFGGVDEMAAEALAGARGGERGARGGVDTRGARGEVDTRGGETREGVVEVLGIGVKAAVLGRGVIAEVGFVTAAT